MDKQTPILLTGATGFIGAHILQQLLAEGYENIRALRRPDSDMALVQDLTDRVDWVEGDVLDIFSLEEAMQGVEQVCHAAALVSFDPADEAYMTKVNVEGTANVVNIALHLGISKLTYISSIAALGRGKEGATLDEKAGWVRSPLNTRYAISKYQGEQEVWRGYAEGLKVAIVNPSIVLGSGFWQSGPPHFFQLAWKGFRFYPAGATGLVDVRDVARFTAQLMGSSIVNERFILNAEHYTYRQLLTEIALSLGKKPPSIKVGPVLRRVAWRLAWLQAKLTGKRPFLTRETARTSSTVFYYRNDKSLRLFGFAYTPIAQTIQETAAVFLATDGELAARLPIGVQKAN